MSGFAASIGVLGKGLALLNKVSQMIHDNQVKQSGMDAQKLKEMQAIQNDIQKANIAAQRIDIDADERRRLRDKFSRK